MLRLGIGVAIGWFAYDALQKRGDTIPDMIKTYAVKAIEAVGSLKKEAPFEQPTNSQLLSTLEEGKEECTN